MKDFISNERIDIIVNKLKEYGIIDGIIGEQSNNTPPLIRYNGLVDKILTYERVLREMSSHLMQKEGINGAIESFYKEKPTEYPGEIVE